MTTQNSINANASTPLLPVNGGTGENNGSHTITLAGDLTTSGANPLTLTTTGSTNVTLPTTGTLVNTAVTTLSSLTSIGTIGTGTWQGTTVSPTYGGSGVSNPTAHGILVAEGSSAFVSKTLTNGQLLIGNTSNDPSAATITAGSGITVTNAAGSITIAASGGGGSGFTQVQMQVFTSSGTYTPTSGMKYVVVETLGAGGGGGGANGGSSGAVGGGGGGGGYDRATFSSSAVGASATITVGTGGTAGSTVGGNGGTGGGSEFLGANTADIMSNGGGGGGGATLANNVIQGGSGAAVSNYGTLSIFGNAGGVGYNTPSGGYSGVGANSMYGGGGKSVIGFPDSGKAPSAGSYGAGGSGGADAGAGGRAGGAGSGGLVIVTEYI